MKKEHKLYDFVEVLDKYNEYCGLVGRVVETRIIDGEEAIHVKILESYKFDNAYTWCDKVLVKSTTVKGYTLNTLESNYE